MADVVFAQTKVAGDRNINFKVIYSAFHAVASRSHDWCSRVVRIRGMHLCGAGLSGVAGHAGGGVRGLLRGHRGAHHRAPDPRQR